MALEKNLQTRILKYLRSQPGWWVKISDKYVVGIPDIIGCYNGKFVAIEVKAPGKAPTAKQRYELDQIIKNKGEAICTDNFADFKEFIENRVYNI